MARVPSKDELALAYNVSQGFSANEIKIVQQACYGSLYEATGVWDIKDIDAIRSFQKAEDIKADGKIWRNDRGNTWPVIKAFYLYCSDTPKDLVFSAWVGDSPREVLQSDDFFLRLRDMGFSVFALMINRANTAEGSDPFSLRWSYERVMRALDIALRLDLKLDLTFWFRPSKEQLDQIGAFLEPIMKHKHPALHGVEGDVEGNWDDDFLTDDFLSMREAAEYTHDMIRYLRQIHRFVFATTTHLGHTECGPEAELSRYADQFFAQCYGIRNRKHAGKPWAVPWSHRYGPGRIQEWGLGRARLIPNRNLDISCGIPAWDQEWPGRTPEQAMQRQILTAVSCGVKELRVWDTRYITGKKATEYSAAFFDNLGTYIR